MKLDVDEVVVAILLLEVVYICGSFILILHFFSRAVVLKIKLPIVWYAISC